MNSRLNSSMLVQRQRQVPSTRQSRPVQQSRPVTHTRQQSVRQQTQQVKPVTQSSRQIPQVKPAVEASVDSLPVNYKPSECVVKAYESFKEFYGSRVEMVNIKDIINGEIVQTDPENIFICDKNNDFKLENIDKQQKYCTKKLYDYQIDAIQKLRELECSQYFIKADQQGNLFRYTSNEWLLKLPIGSGKTLVFTFLAMFYPNIPVKPIVMSTSGVNIPDAEMIRLNYYPFYYENAGVIDKLIPITEDIEKAIEKDRECIDDDLIYEHNGQRYLVDHQDNCGVVMKDYSPRPMTVIITHYHLLDQLKDYIKSDFSKALIAKKKIHYATSANQVKTDVDILVVPCETSIINKLVELSYNAPFTRVIVDDYTNMVGVGEYRQILAISTILVSGSGFNREKKNIPPSYYTLKHMEDKKFSLVAKPEDTIKGIMRNSIATLNLIGANTEFSMYNFVNDVEEYCQSKFGEHPMYLYKPIAEGNKLIDYLKLVFLYHNLSRLSSAVLNMDKDIANGKLNKERTKYYNQWKEMMFIPNTYTRKVPKSRTNKTGEEVVEEISQLTKLLYRENIGGKAEIPAIVMQTCACCGMSSDRHIGWGVVSSCCGSFFCTSCLDSMTTKEIVLRTDKDTQIKDTEHYYCVVCHSKDPRYILNTCRHKEKNLQPYNMMVDNFDMDDIIKVDGVKVDYYFKMLMEGLVPRKHNGKIITSIPEVKVDVEFNDSDDVHNLESGMRINCVKDYNIVNNKIDEINNSSDKHDYSSLIPQLFAKDRLGILAFNRIEEVLKQLKINPSENTTTTPNILIYNCPDILHHRIKGYFDVFAKDPESPLFKFNLLFASSMGELIGLHKNILAILVWNEAQHTDEHRQLIGRILRLNAWCNPLYFYITCKGYNL